MRPLPTTLLIDLDDTLISFGSREALFQRICGEFAPTLGTISVTDAARQMEDAMRRFWEDEENSRVWSHRLRESRHVVLGPLLDAWGVQRAEAMRFADRFHELRESDAGVLFEGAVSVLEELRRRGHRLGLLTNGHAMVQREKLRRFSLSSLFDHIQIDEEVGFGKPDRRAYLVALNALGAEPGDSAMIGDNLEWEVAAPQRLGMMGIWHDHLGIGLPLGTAVCPDLIIRHWSDLLEYPSEEKRSQRNNNC